MKTKAKTMTTLLEGDGRVRRTREADERTNEGRVARSVSFVSSHESSIRTHFLAGFLRFFGIHTLASLSPPTWGRRDAMARLVFDGSRTVEMKVEGYRALMKDLICQGGHFRESSIVNRTQLRKDLPKDSRGNPGSCFFPRRVKHGTRMERSVVESRQRSKSRGRGAVSSRPVVVVAGRGVVLGGDDHGDGG